MRCLLLIDTPLGVLEVRAIRRIQVLLFAFTLDFFNVLIQVIVLGGALSFFGLASHQRFRCLLDRLEIMLVVMYLDLVSCLILRFHDIFQPFLLDPRIIDEEQFSLCGLDGLKYT